MHAVLFLLLLGWASALPQLPHDDAVRVAEFYRLAAQVQDQVWPHWSDTPAPLILVEEDGEFLTHHPSPPKDFIKVGDDLYERPRQFSPHLLATFPAIGPPAAIVIGSAENTEAKTSTPWLITLMHEHFHQLQDAHPGYYDAVEKLGLDGGDKSGMWMLNYPFPNDSPEVSHGFAKLRDLLLVALSDRSTFDKTAGEYLRERKLVFSKLSPNDRKYFNFQLWQEGIARYAQIKSAEAAANYRPSAEYQKLADYESFADYASTARQETLDELKHADMAKMKRVFVYSFGAAEGLLLDRLNPGWRSGYFNHLLSTEAFFEEKAQ
jgi:hypothetical protein